MDLELGGKTVLVTGSWRGTGLVIARRLADEGAEVILHGLEPGTLDEACAAIPDARSVVGDITTEDGAAAVIDGVGESLDVLVNNYGTATRSTWQPETTPPRLDTATWLDGYEKNALSSARLATAFIPALSNSTAGRIVNVGTIGSTRPGEGNPHYYAAKGALANLTVSLSKALAGTGITVNLVSPGLIRTPEVEAGYLKVARREGWGNDFESAEAAIAERFFPNPLGRIATREEVADVVVFIASARASFINGQNLRVDGGALGVL